ncbi:MAG: chromosomal replication initiator DnaA [Rhizobiales bacterium]|nr:chromosomal replication initiator DnaA [Hyphomicrobiales bacterium]OJY46098.1 MAG: chromosomal replication initiator DnaA [Rhizobiales bacterium 64-17]
MNRPRQLALALPHTESFAREDFLPGPGNEAALALVDRWPDWPARAAVLAGPEGAGKSHLGAIWAQTAGARILAARGLGEADLPEALATGALLLEDLAPDERDERALFHLLNLVREHQAYLLITSRVMPVSLPVRIPDLASRLRAVPAVAMAPPDDALLRSLLVKLAADRQLALGEDVVTFLMARIERSFAGARAAIARLDEEAMRLKRPVSRALAAELFRLPDA